MVDVTGYFCILTASTNQGQKIMTIQISWEDFHKNYQPIDNPVTDNTCLEGQLFGCKGADFEYVQSVYEATPDRVWTYMIVDCPTINSGMHYVNREGYIITKLDSEGDIEVIDEDDLEEFLAA
jgi:hypothetical protein